MIKEASLIKTMNIQVAAAISCKENRKLEEELSTNKEVEAKSSKENDGKSSQLLVVFWRQIKSEETQTSRELHHGY